MRLTVNLKSLKGRCLNDQVVFKYAWKLQNNVETSKLREIYTSFKVVYFYTCEIVLNMELR